MVLPYTQTLPPSKATSSGVPDTENVPISAPVLANSFVTELLPEMAFVIQMYSASKATLVGADPAGETCYCYSLGIHLTDRAIALVGNPDICAVKGESCRGRSDRNCV